MDKCKMCDNTFKRKYRSKGLRKEYCSKKCRYSDFFVEKTCLTCGKLFTKNTLSTKSDLYCSLACIQRHPCELCGKTITGRKTFQSFPKRFCSRACAAFVNVSLKAKKAYVCKGFAQSIKLRGEISCNRCGNDDIQVLVVHHLDGDRTNNSLENLETLCSNCHHRIHWGKGQRRILTALYAQKIASRL